MITDHLFYFQPNLINVQKLNFPLAFNITHDQSCIVEPKNEKEWVFWHKFGEFPRGFGIGISEISITNQIAFAKSIVISLDLGKDLTRSFIKTSQTFDGAIYQLSLGK